MKTSQVGVDLIKQFEGFSSKSYPDPGSGGDPVTIGFGSTRYTNGKSVKLGETITKEQAETMLKYDLVKFENQVNSKIKINLSQNQFDALVSHTYNTGGSDTLFKLINEGKDIKTWWTTKYITGSGKVLSGLVKRRLEEYKLFIK